MASDLDEVINGCGITMEIVRMLFLWIMLFLDNINPVGNSSNTSC